MEGYLLKQGEKIKIFKRRWFVIRTGNGVPGRRPHLYYYERPDSKEKGRIDLEQVHRIQRCDDAPKDVHEFALFTQGRIYRLRAASVEEMDRWVTKLKEFVSIASNTTPVAPQLATKPSQDRAEDHKHAESQSRTSHRAASVMLPRETHTPVKPTHNAAEAPAGLAGFAPRHPNFDGIQLQSSNDIRNSMKDLRSAALGSQKQQPEYSAPSARPPPVAAPAAPAKPAPPSWNAQEDSQELQTARKRLAKAQKLIAKHDNEIQSLRAEVSNLKRENKELQKKVEGQGDTVDHDKRRREAELDELQRKLLSERKLREELSEQYQDVRNELRVLKDSIHIARTAPNVYAAAKSTDDIPEPTPLGAAPKANDPEMSRLQSQSIRSFTSPYPDRKSLATLRSSSVSNINALYEENEGSKRVAWIRDELVNKCKSCNVEFGLFTRKHHCRHCGHIFCHSCSDRVCKVPGYPNPERVCHNCFSTLRSKSISNTSGAAAPPKRTPAPATTETTSDPPVTVLEL